MNRIYKVIWSKTRNCYVAVSEIAKRNGKSCTSVNCGGKANRTRSLRMTAVTLGVTAALFAGSSCFGTPAAWAASSGNSVEVTTGNPNYVYGGYANSTEPDSGRIVGGYSTTVTDAADSNTVTIGAVNVNNRVFGGYSAGGNANLNNLTINSGATIGEQVFGGNSNDSGTGNANKNTVTINGGQFGAEVYGGSSLKGNAGENQVIINSGTMIDVYGGEAAGNATGNIVNISQSSTEVLTTINGCVYGGYTYSGAAGGTTKEEGNKVIISSGTVTKGVYGGYVNDGTGTAGYNSVEISGGMMGGPVYGGYSLRSSGSVNNNTVNVKNRSSGTSVYGGYGKGDVTENIVNFTDSTVSTSIYGGYSTSTTGNVEKNQVKVQGSNFKSMFGGELGGSSTTGSVMNNEVTVDSSTGGYVCGGTANGSGANVSKNKVIITDSTITTYSSVPCVMGGHLDNTFNNTTGEVSGNEVTVKGNSVIKGGDSNISSDICGGFSGSGTNFTSSGDVTGNSVTISDNVTVGGNVYGGYITNSSSTASNNTVTMTGGTVSGKVYGARILPNGIATNNKVELENAKVGRVYGGSSQGGDVSKNTVTISKGQASGVTGGTSLNGNVTENKVEVDGVSFDDEIVGGTSQYGIVSENVVKLSNSTANHKIYGGAGSNNDASRNTVTLSNSTAERAIYGGSSTQGNVEENEVTIEGGTIKADVYGGYTGGNANGNTVTVSDGAEILGNIYGGYSNGYCYYNDNTGNTPSTADDNTITISGSPDLSNSEVFGGHAYSSAQNNTLNILSPATMAGLVGGRIETKGTVAGNTLNVAAKNVKAGYIEGFQNMNFYLPKDIAKDDTMLTVSGGSPTNVKDVTFGVAALSGVNLQKGDTVNLLVNSNGLTTDDALQTVDSSKLADASFLAPNNLATDKKYELSISKKDETTIITTVEDVKEVTPDPEPEPEPTPTPTPEPKPEPKSDSSDRLKSPVETRMAVATMINAGSDLLAGQGMLNAQAAAGDKEAGGGFNSFAAVGLSKLRAMSGSHVDIKGIGLNLGFARELENSKGKLLFGPIVEYGHGDYDSYLDNGLKADGNASYWGLGLIAKQTNSNGFYYEGSLRAGRVKSDYSSQLSEVSHADYDSSATYWAAHLGAGKLVDIGHDNTMDVYGKYFYSHTGSDSAMIHINGQDDTDMHFDSVNSHRLRVGARLIHALNEKNKIYGGLGYQYEFSGDARATYRGDGTPSPGVKGSSGLIELGWQVTPGKGPMAIDFGVTGWVGKQRGVTANLQACWTF